MKKKVLIIISICCLLLLIILGGGIYYASTKINSDDVKKETLAQIKNVFPKADVKIGSLDLNFGAYVKIQMNDFSMFTSRAGKKIELLKVKNLMTKIPLWAIIFGAGKIEIELDSPKVNYHQYNKKIDNWAFAMENNTKKKLSKKPKNKKQLTQSDSDSKISIPGFLSVLKLNFKLTDMEVAYRLHDKSSGKIQISKILLKDLNFKTETAFEIDSHMAFDLPSNEKISLDLLVIGQLNLNTFLEKSILPLITTITLKNTKLSHLKKELPELKTDVELVLNKDGSVKGKVTSNFVDTDVFSAKYFLTKKKIALTDLKVELKIQDFINLIEFNNNMLDVKKALFKSSGNVYIALNTKKIDVDLKFDLKPGLAFNYEGISGVSSLYGSYKKNIISINSTSKLLGGGVNLVFNGFFDPSKKDFNIAKMKPFALNIDVNNIKLERKMVQKILYVSDSKTKKAEKEREQNNDLKEAGKKSKKVPLPVLPPGKIKIGINQVLLGEENFSGKGLISVKPSSVETNYFNFKIESGNGKINQVTKFKKTGIIDNSFKVQLSNIDFTSFSIFLPPEIEKLSGVVNSKTSGSVSLNGSDAPSYDVNLSISAVNGEIKGLNLKKHVEDYVKKIKFLKKSAGKKFDVTDGFKEFSLAGRFKHSKYDLKKIYFKGVKDKIKLNGNGTIFPPPLKEVGKIDLEYSDELGVSKILNKEVGTKILPIRVKGPGFSLSADYQYTLKKLAKKAIKSRGGKVIKKQGKKILNKLFKGKKAPKGLNKLLKGKKNPFKGLFGN